MLPSKRPLTVCSSLVTKQSLYSINKMVLKSWAKLSRKPQTPHLCHRIDKRRGPVLEDRTRIEANERCDNILPKELRPSCTNLSGSAIKISCISHITEIRLKKVSINVTIMIADSINNGT